MHLSPDERIFWQYGFLKLNATLVFTWVLMLLMTLGSKLITHKLSKDLKRNRFSRNYCNRYSETNRRRRPP
jgi:F-type H+-transporting ATPase subunit a